MKIWGQIWRVLFCLGFVLVNNAVFSNNLRFGTVSCDRTSLQTTISWDNGWNLPNGTGNHDAVWFFAKIKPALGEWQHLRFSTTPAAHFCGNPGLLSLETAQNGEGIMVRNVGNGAGNIASVSLNLAFEEKLSPGIYEIQVFGIEMAFVPESPFWVGDGSSNFALHDSANGQPYFLTSENAIPSDALGADGGKAPAATIPSAYPKGFAGFYLMKYELSQAQYVDFLNTLTFEQQKARTASDPEGATGTLALAGVNANRSAVVLAAHGHPDESTARYACNLDGGANNGDQDGQNRACNWLSWPDLAAYLDWAALRPITELEFEKACRGNLAPESGEFAWGTPEIVDANAVLNDGSPAEGVSDSATFNAGLGSHGYNGPQGPLRCGFGANSASDRLQAGAGFYGHMELSGNLWELCVSARTTGLNFQGGLGDGTISPTGEANVNDWPGPEGVGFKGGAWNSGIIPGFRDLAVSDRFYIDWASDVRRNTAGGRGAR
ncbi:MAG: SUMF1/EgtB/PvdO family nonheme iron enzyme [Bacteroidetes bacterium]|nr:SUMF1/EgtB/PvdO family nonheme iron enzyme [Bacteroidota bacterium]